MTYKNVLIELKNRPEEKKLLLGGGWTKDRVGWVPSETPDCGCALAELVPGLLEQVNKRTGIRSNRSFTGVFGGYYSQEKKVDLHGMTFTEAADLEQYNDRCIPNDNTTENCKQRAKVVEDFLTRKVLAEAELLDRQATEASATLNKEVINPS